MNDPHREVPPGSRLELLDSIAYATPRMAGAVIVSGSHGGLSAARFAVDARPRLVVFNDAGGGLDDAGVSGLHWLGEQGIAAAAVGHMTARIGEARSTLSDGVVTRVNAPAAALGVRCGMRCEEAVAVAGASDPRTRAGSLL